MLILVNTVPVEQMNSSDKGVLPQCPSTTEILCLQCCICLLKTLWHGCISNHSQLYFLLQSVFNIGYKEDWSEVIQYQRGTIFHSQCIVWGFSQRISVCPLLQDCVASWVWLQPVTNTCTWPEGSACCELVCKHATDNFEDGNRKMWHDS